MLTTRYGLDIREIVARERRLARRAAAFRLLARTAAGAGALGGAAALAATGDAGAALFGASPLALALAARVGGLVTELQLRRARLLLTVLEGVTTRRPAAAAPPLRTRAPAIVEEERAPAEAAIEAPPAI